MVHVCNEHMIQADNVLSPTYSQLDPRPYVFLLFVQTFDWVSLSVGILSSISTASSICDVREILPTLEDLTC